MVDKETGKAKEVDIYDREEKKKTKGDAKARLSNTLEQSIIPANIRKFTIIKLVLIEFE